MREVRRIFDTDAESEECGPPSDAYAAVFRDLAEIERQVRSLSLPMARTLSDRYQRGALADQARQTAKVITHLASVMELEEPALDLT